MAEVKSKIVPTSKQWQFLSAPERYQLYGGAVGGGKTVALCYAAYLQSILIPGNVGYMCRYLLADFKRTVLPTLMEVIPPELIAEHHRTDRYIKLWPMQEGQPGSTIWYGGLKEELEEFGAQRGVRESPIKSMTLGWAAIDQAEEVSRTAFNWIASRLRLKVPNVNYKIYMTANPQPGWVRDDFIERKKQDHNFTPALPDDNPHLPDDYVSRLEELYPPEMVARLLRGEWDIDTSLNSLIQSEWITQAVSNQIEPVGVKIAGVDVARYGKDRTVYLVRQGGKVLHVESWGYKDTTYSAAKIARLLDADQIHHANVDSIGVGAGVVDPLKAHGYNIHEINVGEAALHNDVYANKRAENFNNLMKLFRDEKIDIPDHPDLQSELSAIRYRFDHKSRMIIVPKEEYVRRWGKSPDFADALMLAFCDGLNMNRAGRRNARVDYHGTGVDYGRRINDQELVRAGDSRAVRNTA